MPAKVTVDEVDQMIKTQIPIGSSIAQVKDFIDSLRIDSLKIVRDEYRPMLPYDNLERIPADVAAAAQGHLAAAIVNVERDQLAAYNIDLYFYFNKDGRLLHYTVSRHGTVP